MMRGRPRRDPLRGMIDDIRVVAGNIVIEPAATCTPRQLDQVIGVMVKNGARVRVRVGARATPVDCVAMVASPVVAS